MNIPADHPDAGSPLLAAAMQAFVRLGAHVWVRSDGDNLVRSVAQSRAPNAPRRVEVHAQGLPNLVHELVHALLAGRVDDDHGIDYHAIPFDLATATGRAMLWDELSCCVLSCAYLADDLKRKGITSDRTAEVVDDWFREQVEIQPVFYGMEDAPRRFFAVVARLLDAFGAEADAVVARAFAVTEEALTAAGAAPAVSQPRVRERLTAIWARAVTARAKAGGIA